MSAGSYFVYMLASRIGGTIYIGVTSNLRARVWQHRNDVVDGFTRRYGVHKLVWFEPHTDIREAIRRESSSRSGNASGRSG